MAISTKTKISQGMDRWIHSTREEIHDALDDYIVETPFGFSLNSSFIDAMIELGGNVKIAKKEKTAENKEGVSELFIDKIWEMLPIKNHLVGGQLFKPSKSDFNERMIKFNSKYQYSEEVLYNAFKMYISEVNNCSDGERQYKRTLLYFIWKQDAGSTLSSYCEEVLSGEERITASTNTFSLK